MEGKKVVVLRFSQQCGRLPRGQDAGRLLDGLRCFRMPWRPPKVNATAYSSAAADSDLASAPELCPCGAPAAATSPYGAFVNKPSLFPALT
jgi:hypothetical protein